MNEEPTLFESAATVDPATNGTPLPDKVNGHPQPPEAPAPNRRKRGNPNLAKDSAQTRIGTLDPHLLGRLSGQARRRNREALEAITALSSQQSKEIEELRTIPENITAQRLAILNNQIVRTEECLNTKRLEPRDRAQLLNALDRLLERERILRGIAAPAPFRAPRQTRQSSSNTAEPL
jgi:hypothetical protein